jgi:hypothetical protein
LYVLPYGQMSLWGATVITNMLSAIPWIGGDFVEFVWGGFLTGPCNSNITLKILLDAGNSTLLAFMYFGIKNNSNVKIINTSGQSAGVITYSSNNLKAPQRLNAENFYPYLVGLIEGDGWFTIVKNGKYLIYEIGIEIHIRDIQLLYKIKSRLNVGVIFIRKDKNGEPLSRIFRVRNKTHLKDIILPIFDKYPILSIKQNDYLRFRHNLLSKVIYSINLEEYTRPIEIIDNDKVNTILSVSYFSSWLIGFIESEGCFSIYKRANHSSNIRSFDIAQTGANNLITAIKIYISFTQKVHVDKTNSSKLKVSSVRSIENVVKFIQKAPIKLQGHKKLQYLLWLKRLRETPRYSKKFKIPEKY